MARVGAHLIRLYSLREVNELRRTHRPKEASSGNLPHCHRALQVSRTIMDGEAETLDPKRGSV